MKLFSKAVLTGLALAAGMTVAHAAAAAEYVSVVQEIDVNKPAAVVWKKVGDFCSIKDWLGGGRLTCTYASGDGGLGTDRLLAGRIHEVMVSRSDMSYTYTQPLSPIEYHGTVEVKPVSKSTSKIVYTLFWDQAPLPDQAAKDKDKSGRAAQFMGALKAMKALAEKD